MKIKLVETNEEKAVKKVVDAYIPPPEENPLNDLLDGKMMVNITPDPVEPIVPKIEVKTKWKLKKKRKT